MFMEKEFKEIKKQLDNSENPLFFFDDDTDGLSSFLLFRRYLDRGKGVVVKSSPILDVEFLRKVEEYNPDKIFVLDKPIVSQEFIDKVNVPLIWIDHHTPVERKGVRYYNPRLIDQNIYLPTSYICYKVVNQDLWIAMVGILGDHCMPDVMDEFYKKYKDLLKKTKNVEEILYKTKFGELIRTYSFLLKGKTSDVNKSINILLKIETPYEILDKETPRARFLYNRFERINRQYSALFERALEFSSKDLIFLFIYPSTKMSFSGDLANELSYRFPNKIIIVGREKNGLLRLSIRSRKLKILPAVEHAVKGLEGYGGGHEYACGSNIRKEDLNIYIERIRKFIQK